ncbi:MAG: hypothetical protein F6K36_20090 [Symploca sp. SIO3C6]|nr:hypothetical protein [Symploca sp. SIO3C6]
MYFAWHQHFSEALILERKTSRIVNKAMVKPFDPEEGWPFDEQTERECPFGRTLEDYTLTGKLRSFHNSFDSSLRAILQDCLYRIDDQEGVITFQILCPNETVYKRLLKKREKVRRSVGIVGEIDYYALCIERDGLHCQVLDTNSYNGGI